MKLYTCKQAPLEWVGEDTDGKLYLFDSTSTGWANKRPYKGHKRALAEAPAYNATGTGWPGASTHGGGGRGQGRKPGSKNKGSLSRTSKTMRLRNDLLERAAQHPATLTDVVEMGLERYLDEYEKRAREEDATAST